MVDIRTDIDDAADAIEEAFERARKRLLFKYVKEALVEDLSDWRDVMRRRTRTIIRKRRGRLFKGIRTEVRGRSLNSLYTRKYFADNVADQARLLEYGGTVTPQGGNWLAIPVGRALDSRGVPIRRGPRSWPGLKYVPKSKETAFLVPEGERMRDAYYILKKEVTVDPQLGATLVHENQEATRTRRIGEAATRAIQESLAMRRGRR